MQLSKLENQAYETLRNNSVYLFEIRDLSLILNINKTKTYNLIKALKKKKAIEKIGKGKFMLKEANEYEIASEINSPSYISFISALNYYGFSDQMPRKIYLSSLKYSKELDKFKFITLSKHRFFGYTKIGNIVIAEKEKVILDSLLFPKYSLGIKEVERSLVRSISELDLKKLFDYAIKMNSKSVLRRLGYILEKINIKNKEINKIRNHIGKGYELLDPSIKRKNNLNKRWLLDINI